jgi:hypothetical protein
MENLYALDLRIPTIHNIAPLLSPTPTPTQTPTPTPSPTPSVAQTPTVSPSPTQSPELQTPIQTQTEINTPSPYFPTKEKPLLDFWQITTIILLTAIFTGFVTALILSRKKKEKE